MSLTIKKITLLATILLLSLSSCRDGEIINVDGSGEEALKGNSEVATLMQRTATNDGSKDNILDRANCFNLSFPVTVFANGLEITVRSEADLDLVEDIFDALDDDDDEIVLQFPVIIVLSDHSKITINNYDELDKYLDECPGENEFDDDIECIDFVYPINATIFNMNTELTNNITITNDVEMYHFIEDLDDDDVVNMSFPISVVLSDGTMVSIDSLLELEMVIDSAEDDCDEDDDYDYNDDDCLACTTAELIDIFSDCSDWIVNKLEINGDGFEDNFDDFVFTFQSDGTIIVMENINIIIGTWSTTGSGENITVTLNIPGFPEFNKDWILHEIDGDDDEKDVDLRLGDDRLVWESNSCSF